MYRIHSQGNHPAMKLPPPWRSAMTVLATMGVLLLAMSWMTMSHAAPAPWYWWVSKVDGRRVCAQHMPAQGWERDAGPFAQAGCKVR